MSGSQFEGVFNLAPQIAGNILGSPYNHYRAIDANNPTAPARLLGSLKAWITADQKGMGVLAPGYAKPFWYGMFDPTLTQVGDYFIGPLGTWFITSQNIPMPMEVVNCNHTITISHPADMGSFGAQSQYGGDQRSTEIAIAVNWPCSMLQGTKGETGSTKLPGDVKQPWVQILLPAIPGVNLRNNFIATDETGQRHIMSSCELSSLGWRITAALATT